MSCFVPLTYFLHNKTGLGYSVFFLSFIQLYHQLCQQRRILKLVSAIGDQVSYKKTLTLLLSRMKFSFLLEAIAMSVFTMHAFTWRMQWWCMQPLKKFVSESRSLLHIALYHMIMNIVVKNQLGHPFPVKPASSGCGSSPFPSLKPVRLPHINQAHKPTITGNLAMQHTVVQWGYLI